MADRRPGGPDLGRGASRRGDGASSKVLAHAAPTYGCGDLDGARRARILLLYNADQPWERLNVADTVKIPWQAYLGARAIRCCRIRAGCWRRSSPTTPGRHDALCGGGLAARRTVRQPRRQARPRSPGICRRASRCSSGVRVQGDGSLSFHSAPPGAGRSVTLRCELSVLVLIADVPHPARPVDRRVRARPAGGASPGAATATTRRARSVVGVSTPELRRALENSADYWEARS